MADKYRAGDHYTTCDRTGFKVRASEARKEWTGAIVRNKSWEPRHPQDFVRGKRDDMAADGKNPPPLFMGPLATSITAPTAAGGYDLEVESTERFASGDHISFPLANGDTLRAVVTHILSLQGLRLDRQLPEAVLVGGQVTNYSAVSPPNLG